MLALLLAAGASLWLTGRAGLPRVAVAGVEVRLLEGSKALVLVRLAVTNTLDLPVTVKAADYSLSAAGEPIIKGRLAVKRSVAAGKSGTVTLSMTADSKRLRALRKGAGKVAISGRVHGTLAGRELTVPFSIIRPVPAGKAGPGGRVESFQVRLMPGGEAKVRVVLAVKNPMSRQLNAVRTTYTASLGGKEVARGTAATEGSIKPGGQGRLKIRMVVHLKDALGPRPAPLPMKVRGAVVCSLGGADLEFPFSLEKTLPAAAARGACSVRGLDLRMGSGRELGVLARVACLKPDGGKLQSGRATYRVTLAGQEVARGAVSIGQGDSSAPELLVEVPVTINLQRLKQSRAASGGAAIPLTISGQLTAVLGAGEKSKESTIPFELTKDVTPTAGLRVELVSLGVRLTGRRVRLTPRLRVSAASSLKGVDRLAATYSVSLAGRTVGHGRVRLNGFARGKEILAQGVLKLDQLRAVKDAARATGGKLNLLIRGQLAIKRAGATQQVPFSFRRSVKLAGGGLSLGVRGIQVDAAGKDGALNLILELEVKSQLPRAVSSVSASYTATLQDQELARGTLRLPAVRPNESTRGRLTIRLEPERLKALRKRQVGGKVSLVLRGNLTAPLPGKSAPLRVSFSLVRAVSLGDGGLQISIKKLQMSEGKGGLNALVTLGIRSRLSMTVEELRVDYSVAVGGAHLLDGRASMERLEPLGEGTLDARLTITPAALKTPRSEAGPTRLQIRGHLRGVVSPGAGMPRRAISIPFKLRRALHRTQGGKVSVAGVSLREIGTDHISLDLRLKLHGLSLGSGWRARVTYSVVAAGAQMLYGRTALKGESKQVLLPMRIATARLKAVKKASKGRKIPFLISGHVTGSRGGKGGSKFDFPFSVSKEVAFQEKPFEVMLAKIRLVSLKGGTRTIHVGLDVINRTGRAIKDLAVEGDVTLAPGVQVEVRNRSLTLRPGKSARLNLLVKAKRFALLKLLGRLIRKRRAAGRMRLRFRGKTETGATITSRLEGDASGPVERSKPE